MFCPKRVLYVLTVIFQYYVDGRYTPTPKTVTICAKRIVTPKFAFHTQTPLGGDRSTHDKNQACVLRRGFSQDAAKMHTRSGPKLQPCLNSLARGYIIATITLPGYCFRPNQEAKRIDTPCFPDQEVSPCCSDDMDCLGNGLCYNGTTKMMFRGTCTDKTWKSPSCPQYCVENEFKGEDAGIFSEHPPAVWTCSDRWAGQGGLMCCNILTVWDGEFNRSCCPGVGAINLFSIGSKPGTVKSITMSTSSSSSNRSSSVAIITSRVSSSLSATPLIPAIPKATTSNGIASPASSSAPSQSQSKGSTIAMAVGISVGALLLIIASYLIYRRLQRRNKRDAKEDQLVEESIGSEEDHGPRELTGHQEHELPSSGQQKHELSSSEQQINEMPPSEQPGHEMPSSEQHDPEKKMPAKPKYSRQELEG